MIFLGFRCFAEYPYPSGLVIKKKKKKIKSIRNQGRNLSIQVIEQSLEQSTPVQVTVLFLFGSIRKYFIFLYNMMRKINNKIVQTKIAHL